MVFVSSEQLTIFTTHVSSLLCCKISSTSKSCLPDHEHTFLIWYISAKSTWVLLDVVRTNDLNVKDLSKLKRREPMSAPRSRRYWVASSALLSSYMFYLTLPSKLGRSHLMSLHCLSKNGNEGFHSGWPPKYGGAPYYVVFVTLKIINKDMASLSLYTQNLSCLRCIYQNFIPSSWWEWGDSLNIDKWSKFLYKYPMCALRMYKTPSGALCLYTNHLEEYFPLSKHNAYEPRLQFFCSEIRMQAAWWPLSSKFSSSWYMDSGSQTERWMAHVLFCSVSRARRSQNHTVSFSLIEPISASLVQYSSAQNISCGCHVTGGNAAMDINNRSKLWLYWHIDPVSLFLHHNMKSVSDQCCHQN